MCSKNSLKVTRHVSEGASRFANIAFRHSGRPDQAQRHTESHGRLFLSRNLILSRNLKIIPGQFLSSAVPSVVSVWLLVGVSRRIFFVSRRIFFSLVFFKGGVFRAGFRGIRFGSVNSLRELWIR